MSKLMTYGQQVRNKYPNKVPIKIESKLPLTHTKFLVQEDTSVGQFLLYMRKRFHIKPEEAIFIFCEDSIPPVSSTLKEIYSQKRRGDDILYFTLNLENTFGTSLVG